MIWVILLLPLLYVAIGFILTEKNAPTLMSGYNTLSDEEKAAYPLAASVRFFKRFHWGMGLLSLLGGVCFWVLDYPELALNTVVLFPLLAYGYFIYRQMRYAPKSQKTLMRFVFVLLLVVTAGVGFLFVYGAQPNTLQLRDTVLIIDGMYGVSLPKEQISGIQLTDSLPKIRMKTNGYATANLHKGFFRTKDGRTLRLFLSDRDAAMLHIQLVAGKDIYYQSPDENAEALYEKVNNWLNP